MAVEYPKEYWRVPSAAENYEAERFCGWKGRLYRFLEEQAIQRALRPVAQGSRVLDTACGSGRITLLLLKQQLTVVSCDISLPMIQVARRGIAERGGKGAFFQSDVVCLPCGDASFDLVSCVGLFMHLDPETRIRTLQELTRASRRLLLLQYGCVGTFLRFKTSVTGSQAGDVRYPIGEEEIRTDLRRCGLQELTRFWVLRPFSSSLVLLLTKEVGAG